MIFSTSERYIPTFFNTRLYNEKDHKNFPTRNYFLFSPPTNSHQLKHANCLNLDTCFGHEKKTWTNKHYILFNRNEALKNITFSKVWRYPLGPHVTSTSSKPFHFFAGDQLVVPIGAFAHFLWLQEIQSREREKKKEQRTICLGLTQVQDRELCNTLHFLCAFID